MYNLNLSKFLAEISELTYAQYNKGLPPPENQGKVKLPAGYTQIASFTAPEVDIMKSLDKHKDVDWHNLKDNEDIRAINGDFKTVYFGFAATSPSHNIIALRGTQSAYEWIMDFTIPQVPVPLFWFNHRHFEIAKVHLGFMIFYTLLIDQIIEACHTFDHNLPCFVTGHSLGAALATLVAPSIKLMTKNENVKMYNFASPRVANSAFVDAYNFLISESYRVVNLSDLVPMIPPTKIFSWEYAHVGQEWSFINQSGNVAGNHALIGPHNYTDAVDKEIPTNAARTYPVSGL